MGVMACGRRGCNQVMCDRMVRTGDDLQYICDDCLAELRAVITALPHDTDADVVLSRVEEFMYQDKVCAPRCLDDAYFDRVVLVTPDSW